MKPPKHKICGTEHWSTQPCPAYGHTTKIHKPADEPLHMEMRFPAAKIIGDAGVTMKSYGSGNPKLGASLAQAQTAEIITAVKRGRPRTTTPEQRKVYLAKKAKERRAKAKHAR